MADGRLSRSRAVDSGGYGAVTIGKTVSIISPPGIYAGISVFSGAGVAINAPGATVVLRGLSINCQGEAAASTSRRRRASASRTASCLASRQKALTMPPQVRR
jgi:hypothetical protein